MMEPCGAPMESLWTLTADDKIPALPKTLNYGNYGTFGIVGNAGFVSSTVFWGSLLEI